MIYLVRLWNVKSLWWDILVILSYCLCNNRAVSVVLFCHKGKKGSLNSSAPEKIEWNFRYVIFKKILVIDGWGISCEIAVIWMSLDFTDDQSTLVQVIVWCHQATSHYLSQCWPRFLSPYGVTMPQWVNLFLHCCSCWLNVSTGAIWAFVGPVVGVITVNIVMLSIAIYVMCKHANMAAKLKMKEHSQVEKIRWEKWIFCL